MVAYIGVINKLNLGEGNIKDISISGSGIKYSANGSKLTVVCSIPGKNLLSYKLNDVAYTKTIISKRVDPQEFHLFN